MPRPCANDHDLTPRECAVCRACVDPSERGKARRAHWGEPEPTAFAARRQSLIKLPCIHLAGPTGESHQCQECVRKVDVQVMGCDLHGKCTTEKLLPGPGIECCRLCKTRATIEPSQRTRIDAGKLSPGGIAFNASLHRHNGRLLLAYRNRWAGSQIHVAELDDELNVVGAPRHLPLFHAAATYGQEDPRLFTHAGKLHVAYIGVIGEQGPTNVLYAELGDDLGVRGIWHPAYAKRAEWEKNHAYFSHDGALFAIYSIDPHVVLHVRGDDAYPFAEQPVKMPWSGGVLRGGAPPVRVGDEYWHWFHGSVDPGGRTPKGTASVRTYNMGVYAFEARPPFRPTRITPEPVLWADGTVTEPVTWCSVVFPCGAVHDGDRWRVSAGINDHFIDIIEFDHRHIERSLVPC